MKIYAPEYYKYFKCIADRCKHSCCIGWEIDIDRETAEFYRSVSGDFGERLKKCISDDVETHFILGENERCPFLNENNLCDIYAELGEENLCQICSDHPRFRNFFKNHTEVGLGLCCEAAADLILNWDKPFSLVVVGEEEESEDFDEEEDVFFAMRQKAFDIISDESKSIRKCTQELLECFNCGVRFAPPEEWIDIFLELEILDDDWRKILENARGCNHLQLDIFKSPKGQMIQRQLLLYFVYRQTADGIYDKTVWKRIGFAVLGLYMIKFICAANENPTLELFKDIARRYSAEIEYSEENVKKLLTFFGRVLP